MAKPKLPANFDTLPTEERIKYHYEHGQGSIQDIARSYRVPVEDVLHIIGQDEMLSVPLGGDQVDADDVNRVPGMSYNYGTTQRVTYTTD